MPETRPNEEDLDAIDLLLENDRLDERSARFIESLAEALADDGAPPWSREQIKWFDDLCQRYL